MRDILDSVLEAAIIADAEDKAHMVECGGIQVLWKYREHDSHLVGLALVENCRAHLEQDLGSSSIQCPSDPIL